MHQTKERQKFHAITVITLCVSAVRLTAHGEVDGAGGRSSLRLTARADSLNKREKERPTAHADGLCIRQKQDRISNALEK